MAFPPSLFIHRDNWLEDLMRDSSVTRSTRKPPKPLTVTISCCGRSAGDYRELQSSNPNCKSLVGMGYSVNYERRMADGKPIFQVCCVLRYQSRFSYPGPRNDKVKHRVEIWGPVLRDCFLSARLAAEGLEYP